MTQATIKCISPIDNSVYAEEPLADKHTALTKIAAARLAQQNWAARPLSERVDLVRKGLEQLCAMASEVTPELAWMMGRPVRYGGEFGGVRERVCYMADIAEEALQPIVAEESAAFARYIVREPLGVVMIIAPWNYPYLTAINTVAPALIAGNAVLLKPASQTLLAGKRIAQAFVAAGVPKDIMQNIFLDRETTTSLIADGEFDFVNFTGSVEGGRAMERAAAGTFTGLGLELGGKDPGYVMEDAALDSAVETLMDGAFFNSGQCCCGIERIYVAAPLYDSFIAQAQQIAESHVLGNPLSPDTTLGPMANRKFADAARAQIAEAQAAGASLLVDVKKFPEDNGGVYLAPQILVNVNHSMRVMHEETFAPIVGIMKVQDDDEAVKLINDSEYGLTVSLWTSDAARAAAIGARLQTGTVFMNRADYLDPALCWSGRKNTGRGGALSIIGYHNLTRPKSYHLKKQT
ncbi:MAG: aldehyde dehydrogenase family protein [Gammaproteobacteria bacterium WSBS_2016_MAG_OTU1]